MFDLGRYRAVVIVGSWIAIVLLPLNFALLLVSKNPPEWLAPERRPLGWQVIEETDQIVSGLVSRATPGEAGISCDTDIYIGMSTAREGIDPKILAAAEGRGVRYAGLCGSGADYTCLRTISRSLIRSGLRVGRIHLCLHPTWLVGEKSLRDPTPLNPIPHLLARRWRKAARSVIHWNGPEAVMAFVNHLVRNNLYEARLRLFESCGLSMEAFSPPSPDPWSTPPRLGYPQHAAADFLRAQMEGSEGRGWFDSAAYDRSERARGDVLPGLIETLKSQCTALTVVLMPEQSAYRSRVPDSALSHLTRSLGRLGAEAPRVGDFRTAIPDSEFTDYVHLNDSGRADFSAKLARWIRDGKTQAAPE